MHLHVASAVIPLFKISWRLPRATILISLLLGVAYNALCQPSQHYSVLIGVNKGTGWADTQHSLSKMERMASQNNRHTVVLADAMATRENILDTIAYVGRQINDVQDASFLFYFNGYGAAPDDEEEEQSGYDNAIIVHDGIIRDDELTEILRKFFTTSSNIMIIDAAYPEASVSYGFLLMDFRVGDGAQPYKYEVAARNQMVQRRICSQAQEQVIVDDFNLVYVGSGGLNINRQPAVNNVLTYWLTRIYSERRRNNAHRRITYCDLLCDLRDKITSLGETLHYLEIGNNAASINNQKPF